MSEIDRRPTIDCSAEPWGYGPSAKLLAVAQRLRGRYRCRVVATGSAHAFASMNRDIYDAVDEVASAMSVLDAPGRPSAVLSVMDPWAALRGARLGVPTFYVDSLFWFWRWGDAARGAATEAAAWVAASDEELAQRLASVTNWHTIVPLAYHWSDRVFVQASDDDARRAGDIGHDHLEAVGAVVAEPHPRRPTSGPLISLSGAVSHAGDLSASETYCDLVLELLEPSRDQLAGATFAAPPHLIDRVVAAGWPARSLTATAMARAMAASSFVLAPAGLTTMLEAVATGVPMMFLPEQHGGHRENAHRVGRGDPSAYPDVLLERWFRFDHATPEGAIAELAAAHRTMLEPGGGATLRMVQDHLAAELLRLTQGGPALVARQAACARMLCNGFDGAVTIAKQVIELVA